MESCKECTVKLAAAEGDAASKEKRLGVLQKQLEAIERERDAAVKAAKGGGLLASLPSWRVPPRSLPVWE